MAWLNPAEVDDRQAVLGAQALGHKRAVARLRIALDAEQSGRRVARELGHERADVERDEVERVEDLAGVSLGVLGRERALEPRRVRPGVVGSRTVSWALTSAFAAS
jgi:hypothetical protein